MKYSPQTLHQLSLGPKSSQPSCPISCFAPDQKIGDQSAANVAVKNPKL
jgi:hypothetical protein